MPFDPSECSEEYFTNSRVLKTVATDFLLAIGMAMTMPIHHKLSVDDQVKTNYYNFNAIKNEIIA